MSSTRWRRWLNLRFTPGEGHASPWARRPALLRDWEECEPRALLSLAINNVSIDEPPAPEIATADFTVALDTPNSSQTVTVDYSTVDGTAKAGVDYSPVQGSLTFAPGVTSQSIYVPVFSNPANTADLAFDVALSNPVNDVLSSAASKGTALILGAPANQPTPTATSGTTTTEPPPSAPASTMPAAGSASSTQTATSTPTSTTPPSSPATTPTAAATPAALGTPMPAGTVSTTSGTAAPTTATPAVPAVNPLVVTQAGDSGPGSLRNAIAYADANPGNRPITFNIDSPAPIVIDLLSPLPALTRPVTIDATTEPGYHGSPLVAIDGANAGSQADGLVISGGGSTVVGLAIERFSGSGVVIQSAGGNTIEADDLGTDATGTDGAGNAADGIRIDGSSGNTIGGTVASARDVISDNGLVGVRIEGAGATGNVVEGDLIGTDLNGDSALGNQTDGVFIDGAPGNTVGGTGPAERNVISGNGVVGLQIHGSAATGNRVLGNLIGTDASGASRLGNGRDGVYVDQAPGNAIGGSTAGAGNVIAANGQVGIQLLGPGARRNVVQGNIVGEGPGGASGLGNAFGLYVNHAPGNVIGGTGPAANTIMGNTHANVIPRAAAGKGQSRSAASPTTTRSAGGQSDLHLGSLDLSTLFGSATKSTGGKASSVASQALAVLGQMGNQTQGSD